MGTAGDKALCCVCQRVVPIAAIQPSPRCLHHPRAVRADAALEDPGVLLRQHPLHEGLPENSGALLQRYLPGVAVWGL